MSSVSHSAYCNTQSTWPENNSSLVGLPYRERYRLQERAERQSTSQYIQTVVRLLCSCVVSRLAVTMLALSACLQLANDQSHYFSADAIEKLFADLACTACRCDAQAKPCVVIEQGYGANAMDTVMVDVSTLRSANVAEVPPTRPENAKLHDIPKIQVCTAWAKSMLPSC